MRLPLNVSLLCLMCAACATSPTPPPSNAVATAPKPTTAEAPPPLAVLPFAWPAGASAVVSERVLKKGVEAKLTYRIVVAAREGGGLSVQIKDLKFLEMGGLDIKDSKHAAVIETIEQQAMAAMPAFLVSTEGAFEDVTDYDRLIELSLQRTPEDKRASMREAMKSPAMLALVRQGIASIWGYWAGIWAGQELAEGYVVEVDMLVDVGGTRHTFPASYEHRGPTPGVPGHVDLAFTSKQEGEAAAALTRAAMRAARGTIPRDPDADAAMEKALADMSVTKTTTVQATVDATTLLPLRSSSEEATILVMNGERHDVLERHVYEFAWTLSPR